MLVKKIVFLSRIWFKNLQNNKISIQKTFQVIFSYKKFNILVFKRMFEILAHTDVHNIFSILNCLFTMNWNLVLRSVKEFMTGFKLFFLSQFLYQQCPEVTLTEPLYFYKMSVLLHWSIYNNCCGTKLHDHICHSCYFCHSRCSFDSNFCIFVQTA